MKFAKFVTAWLDISGKYYSNLSVEDDFLLVLMKLRLGLSTIDLAVRFTGNVSEATVSKLFTTWINYLYVRLGDLKIWPHRNVVIAKMPPTFKEKYPNTIIIIDAAELRIQTPSSLLRHSQSYSSYKSTNPFKKWYLNTERSYKRQGHATLKHFVGCFVQWWKAEITVA